MNKDKEFEELREDVGQLRSQVEYLKTLIFSKSKQCARLNRKITKLDIELTWAEKQLETAKNLLIDALNQQSIDGDKIGLLFAYIRQEDT